MISIRAQISQKSQKLQKHYKKFKSQPFIQVTTFYHSIPFFLRTRTCAIYVFHSQPCIHFPAMNFLHFLFDFDKVVQLKRMFHGKLTPRCHNPQP